MNAHAGVIETAANIITPASSIFNRLRAKQGQKLTVEDIKQLEAWMRDIESYIYEMKCHLPLRGSENDSTEARLPALVQHNQTSGADHG